MALSASLIGLLAAAVVSPAAGALSDRLGRRPVLICGATLLLVGVVPACWLATLIGTILRLPDRPRLRSVPVGVLALQPVVIVIAHFSMAPGLAGLQ